MNKTHKDILYVLTTLLILISFGTKGHGQEKTSHETPKDLLSQAVQSLKEYNFDDVIEKTTQVISTCPVSGEVYFIRGTAYYAKSTKASTSPEDKNTLKEKAIADFSEALRLGVKEETKLHIYRLRAAAYREIGKCTESIKDFDVVIKTEPTDFRAFGLRGLCYLSLSNYSSAVNDFTEVLKATPQEAAFYTLRARAYAFLSEHEKALADLNESIKLDPTEITAYQTRAIIYRRLGKKDLADQDEKKVEELKSTKKN